MDMISKKELLALTGISYGQLYRWKREKLIPEQWFIKQSSYTGQETFFPREQILSRVRSILDAKDQYSLEELAKIFSPETADCFISVDDLKQIEEITAAVNKSVEVCYEKDAYEFLEIVLFAALSQLSDLNDGQMEELIKKGIGMLPSLKSMDVVCTVFTAEEVQHLIFTKSAAPVCFDSGIKVLLSCPLSEIANTIKMKYSFTK